MEYRLSPNSNKYLKFFYDRATYDWLEGYVGQFGGGFVWRRKLQSLKDIFRFKRKTDDIYTMPMNGALVQKKNYTIVNNNDSTAAQKKDSTAVKKTKAALSGDKK